MRLSVLVLLLAACATAPPKSATLDCESACGGCEAGCDGNPVCQDKCYAWNSECCANQGRRAVAARCQCY